MLAAAVYALTFYKIIALNIPCLMGQWDSIGLYGNQIAQFNGVVI